MVEIPFPQGIYLTLLQHTLHVTARYEAVQGDQFKTILDLKRNFHD